MQYDGDLCVEHAKNWPYWLLTNCNEQQISINVDAIERREEKEVEINSNTFSALLFRFIELSLCSLFCPSLLRARRETTKSRDKS